MARKSGKVNEDSENKLGLKEWENFETQKGALKLYRERAIKAKQEDFDSGFDVAEYATAT